MDVATIARRLNDAGVDEAARSYALRLALAGQLAGAGAWPADLRELGLVAQVGNPELGVAPFKLGAGMTPIVLMLGRAAEVHLGWGPQGARNFVARVLAPPNAEPSGVNATVEAFTDSLRRPGAVWMGGLVHSTVPGAVALIQRFHL